jgi:hypothetical protein
MNEPIYISYANLVNLTVQAYCMKTLYHATGSDYVVIDLQYTIL